MAGFKSDRMSTQKPMNKGNAVMKKAQAIHVPKTGKYEFPKNGPTKGRK